jgi:hypothetical protein
MRVGSQNDLALLLTPKIFAHFSRHCRFLADWDGPHDLAGSANVSVATINFWSPLKALPGDSTQPLSHATLTGMALKQ